MQKPSSHSSATPPRRPWYRLHLSTIVLMLPIMIVLVLLIVPGEFDQGSGVWQHGWPVVFYENLASSAASVEDQALPAWIDPRAWSMKLPTTNLKGSSLLIDLAAALFICSATAAMLEWRRLRRPSTWQSSRTERVVVVFMVLLACGWWRWNFEQWKAGLDIGAKIQSEANLVYEGPAFARKLFGGYLTQVFQRHSCQTIRLFRQDVELLAIPGHLQDLQDIDIEYPTAIAPIADWVKLHPAVESVSIVLANARDSDLLALAEIPWLRGLTLDTGSEVTARGLRALTKFRHLEFLRVEWPDEKRLPAARVEEIRAVAHLFGDDECIAALSSLTSLTRLDLKNAQCTDDGLISLAALHSLRELTLGGRRITGASLATLTAAKELGRLQIWWGTPITDDGLAALSNLTSLNSLHIASDNQVTDAGLSYLKNLTNLEHIELSGDNFNGIGLDALQQLPRLRRLNLSDCSRLADAAIPLIAEIPALEHLDLQQTPLTDAAIPALKQMTQLHSLYLSELPQLSHASITELRKALPNCRIW